MTICEKWDCGRNAEYVVRVGNSSSNKYTLCSQCFITIREDWDGEIYVEEKINKEEKYL